MGVTISRLHAFTLSRFHPVFLAALVLPLGMVAAAQEPPAVFAPLEPSVLKQFKADALALRDKGGIGKAPWLFYGDELLLNARTVENHLAAVPGIVDLHEQLKSAGVELIYMPVTPKWAVYPDAISDAAKPDAQGRIPRVIPGKRRAVRGLARQRRDLPGSHGTLRERALRRTRSGPPALRHALVAGRPGRGGPGAG